MRLLDGLDKRCMPSSLVMLMGDVLAIDLPRLGTGLQIWAVNGC